MLFTGMHVCEERVQHQGKYEKQRRSQKAKRMKEDAHGGGGRESTEPVLPLGRQRVPAACQWRFPPSLSRPSRHQDRYEYGMALILSKEGSPAVIGWKAISIHVIIAIDFNESM